MSPQTRVKPDGRGSQAWWTWDAEGVVKWLREDAGFGDGVGDAETSKVFSNFLDHDVDGRCLMELTEDELNGLGVTKLARRKRLMRKIRDLPLSSTVDNLETYASAGDSLAIVFALILGIVLALLADLKDFDCSGDGDDGPARSGMCIVLSGSGFLSTALTLQGGFVLMVQTSFARNLRCYAPAVSDRFLEDMDFYSNVSFSVALLSPCLLVVQLASWGWLHADSAGASGIAWTWFWLCLCVAIFPAHYILVKAPSAFSKALNWGRQAKLMSYHWGIQIGGGYTSAA